MLNVRILQAKKTMETNIIPQHFTFELFEAEIAHAQSMIKEIAQPYEAYLWKMHLATLKKAFFERYGIEFHLEQKKRLQAVTC